MFTRCTNGISQNTAVKRNWHAKSKQGGRTVDWPCLHNVLFSQCLGAVAFSNNAVDIEGEQVTADVTDFCASDATPHRIALTNSVILGNSVNAATLLTDHVVFNPSATNFEINGAGRYYLAANSPLHGSGTGSISPTLKDELKNKTTYAPVVIPSEYQLSGEMILGPTAIRDTNSAPDLGYHYDPLDYTVAGMVLQGGALTLLPGTAIGYRMETTTNSGGAYTWWWSYFLAQSWTFIGIDVRDDSTIVSHGTPAKPNVFVDKQAVQEQLDWPIVAGIVPDFLPTTESAQPPSLQFRFTDFYIGNTPYNFFPAYHFWSGMDAYSYFEWSYNSVMNLSLQDCQLSGGQVAIGAPDYYYVSPTNYWGAGSISWNNNSFDDVTVDVEPTAYQYGGGVGVDLSFAAHNNLFKGGWYLHLEPIPASA